MKRYVKWAALLGVCILLAGCMTPEQQQSALAVIDQMLATDVVSAEQHAVLREGILSQGLNAWLIRIGELVAVGIGAVATVQKIRGTSASAGERAARKAAKAARKPDPASPVEA